jgi:hypothetical protein
MEIILGTEVPLVIQELKCNTNTSPRRLVRHLLHQISLSTVVLTSMDNGGMPRLEVTTT